MDQYEKEFVAEAIRMLEEFYPEYLKKTGLTDSDVTKSMYYMFMVEMTRNAEPYDLRPHVLAELERLAREAANRAVQGN